MAHEGERFQNIGLTCAERSRLDGLRAVLAPEGDARTERRNLFMHGVHLFGAKWAMRSDRNVKTVIDFGCGPGRFIRMFGEKGWNVIGTEITPEMIDAAKTAGLPPNARIYLTDGISIPEADNSFDLIWCCAVLRYSLLTNDPVYDRIVAEMFRVLRPGGLVVNVEMYVDNPYSVFTMDFEQIGFKTLKARVLHRYRGRLERYLLNRRLPKTLLVRTGSLCAALRYIFDSPDRKVTGLRDYFFVWQKPC